MQRDPWDADYRTSLETQRKIKLAATASSSSYHNGNGDDTDDDVSCRNANDILMALLDADPRKCNAANVVCALTLSS